jgi:hypothetical protein
MTDDRRVKVIAGMRNVHDTIDELYNAAVALKRILNATTAQEIAAEMNRARVLIEKIEWRHGSECLESE